MRNSEKIMQKITTMGSLTCLIAFVFFLLVSFFYPSKNQVNIHTQLFRVDNKISQMIGLISDLDKRNPRHSLNFYARNPNALQAIEDRLNIENKKNNFLVHLSRISNSVYEGIHISMTNISPENKWKIVKEHCQAISPIESIKLTHDFYGKNLYVSHIINKSESISNDKYRNYLNADIIEVTY